jgi:amidase
LARRNLTVNQRNRDVSPTTSDMASWLEEDYKLTPSEIAQVLGTAAEYHVNEVADRNAGIVLKISKARLATLVK